MTDKDNLQTTFSDDRLLEHLLGEAARQEIADNGFSDRVMQRIAGMEAPAPSMVSCNAATQRLTRLWTLFCVAVGALLFYFVNGWEMLKGSLHVLFSSVATSLEVFLTTAPTVELRLNPVAVLLLLVFLLVVLPYQTYRRLSEAL